LCTLYWKWGYTCSEFFRFGAPRARAAFPPPFCFPFSKGPLKTRSRIPAQQRSNRPTAERSEGTARLGGRREAERHPHWHPAKAASHGGGPGIGGQVLRRQPGLLPDAPPPGPHPWSRRGGRMAPWAALLLPDHGAPPPHPLPRNRRLPPPPARPRCLCLHLPILSILRPAPLPPRHRHPRAPLPRYVTPPDSLASLFSLHDWHGTTDLRLVSVADASLRAGSLMYLFRGDLGCMLYTGDFRWELGCDKARRAKQALLDALGGDTIDVLYLDNTYCHPSLNFPPRPVVAEHVSFA